MATITYTFVSRCAGGDHVTFDVAVNGGPTQRITYDIDDLRKPLSEIPDEIVDVLKQLVLRVHVAGKTRAQLVTEFGSPVTVTI